jgi:hypothetical protein
MPKKSLQFAMEAAVAALTLWHQKVSNGLRNQADHSIAILKRDYREVVTKRMPKLISTLPSKNFDHFIPGSSLLRRVGGKSSTA